MPGLLWHIPLIAQCHGHGGLPWSSSALVMGTVRCPGHLHLLLLLPLPWSRGGRASLPPALTTLATLATLVALVARPPCVFLLLLSAPHRRVRAAHRAADRATDVRCRQCGGRRSHGAARAAHRPRLPRTHNPALDLGQRDTRRPRPARWRHPTLALALALTITITINQPYNLTLTLTRRP